ncbi:MAG: radical SAM protein [Erysipelotrichaceae bacterium]
MNVLIATLNSKYVHASLSVWYLKEAMHQYSKTDCNVKVYESTINVELEKIKDEIISHQPNVLCFSVYIWNVRQTFQLIKMIKESINPTIIIGGPEVSFNDEEVLRNHPEVDYLLRRHGEESLPKLIDALYQNQALPSISGLSYLDEEKIIRHPVSKLTSFINPYTQEFIDQINGRIVYFEASRGCPYQCAFCLSGQDDLPCFFDFELIKENLIKLSHSSSKTIKFVDRTFNAHAKRANDILSFIIDHPELVSHEVTYHFEIAGDILNEELFHTIQRAPVGLFQFEIGLQSFNEETLQEVHRKTNTKILVENIKRLISFNNAHIHIDLIAGLPLEDLVSFKESFNLAYKIKPHMLQLGFLKLLHGSYLRDHRDEYFVAYDLNPPYEVSETKWLKKEEFKLIHQVEDIFERMVNSGRFLYSVDYLLDKTGKNPFDLFLYIAQHIEYDYKVSLDGFTAMIFNLFERDSPLRDALVIDRLSSNASGRIANCLKENFVSLKRYRLALAKIDPEIKGLKRGFEYLSSQQRFIYVDYQDKDIITNHYQAKYIDIHQLDISKV